MLPSTDGDPCRFNSRRYGATCAVENGIIRHLARYSVIHRALHSVYGNSSSLHGDHRIKRIRIAHGISHKFILIRLFLWEKIVRIIDPIVRRGIHIEIYDVVAYTNEIAVPMTVNAHQNAVRTLFVCLIDYVKNVSSVLQSVTTLKALMGEQNARVFRLVDGLPYPIKLLRRDIVPLGRMTVIITARISDVFVAVLVVIRIGYYHTVSARIEIIILVRHLIISDNVLDRASVAVVIAETMVGRNVKFIIRLDKIRDLQARMPKVTCVNYEITALLLRAALKRL